MALLLSACVSPAVAVAARAGPAHRPAARLIPPRRHRLVAVASASASASAAASSAPPSGEVVASRGSDNGGVGGSGSGSGGNGAVAPNAKATAIETTVERVRHPRLSVRSIR